jgi:prepilin-type N-terminal cleavage/methylation domain-containing protein
MVAKRSGFTLLELMLVMMIILITASLAAPAIEGMLSDSRVKAARDLVRARWADTRGQAMKEGRPYVFAVIHGTGKFMVEPEDDKAPSNSDDKPLKIQDELPQGVVFAVGNSNSGSSNSSSSSSGYQHVAVFLADGTARDDVSLMFGKENGATLGLKVRALTGSVMLIDSDKDK